MTQQAVLDFLKELAVGFKSAKSYPPGHPIMEKVVASTLSLLLKLFHDYPEFSFYFLEKTVIFQDMRFDVSKNLAVLSFIEALRKNEIESLTFVVGVNNEDVKNLYEVLSSSKLKIKEYGGPGEMLKVRGTERIKINVVKFGIQAGTVAQVAQETPVSEAPPVSEDITNAIEDFKRLVERGLSALEIKPNLERIVEAGEKIGAERQILHSEAVARILENLPYQHRVELLKDIELKPFVLKILSSLDEEKLLELIVTRREETSEVKKILGAISDSKLAKLLPMLKEKIPDIYEYLAQMGLLLSEKLMVSFSRADLQGVLNPYYNMLESPNARVREEGIKSLTTLAGRFIAQGHIEIVEEIVQRLSLALEREPVFEVINNSIGEIFNFYKAARIANLGKVCDMLVEPFNKIMGRPGIPLLVKRALINFMGETQNPYALPALISFLWESGVYPEVRAAIVKIGKEAVPELLMTLKEAEDHSLRMKIVDVLKNIGKTGLEVLLKNLDAPEWYMRRNIVYLVGEIGAKESASQLEMLVNDPEDRVRLELARTFAKLNYEAGLKMLLQDTAIEVKAEALRALKKTLTNEELIELLPLLKEKGDPFHAEFLKILGERKIEAAFSPVVDYLRNLTFRDDQAAQELKQIALASLFKIGHPETKIILEEFVNSRDKFLASLAQAALKRI